MRDYFEINRSWKLKWIQKYKILIQKYKIHEYHTPFSMTDLSAPSNCKWLPLSLLITISHNNHNDELFRFKMKHSYNGEAPLDHYHQHKMDIIVNYVGLYALYKCQVNMTQVLYIFVPPFRARLMCLAWHISDTFLWDSCF